MRRFGPGSPVGTCSLTVLAVMALSTAAAFLPLPAPAQTLSKGSEPPVARTERPHDRSTQDGSSGMIPWLPLAFAQPLVLLGLLSIPVLVIAAQSVVRR